MYFVGVLCYSILLHTTLPFYDRITLTVKLQTMHAPDVLLYIRFMSGIQVISEACLFMPSITLCTFPLASSLPGITSGKGDFLECEIKYPDVQKCIYFNLLLVVESKGGKTRTYVCAS